MTFIILVFSVIQLVLMLGCSSSSQLISQYKNEIKENSITEERAAKVNFKFKKVPPVILFLVDGLGFKAYVEASESGFLKNTNSFFQSKFLQSKNDNIVQKDKSDKKNENLYLGMTQFPSLTFPNISSILMHKPVSEHWVAHNKLYGYFEDGESDHREVLNLELPLGLEKLNKSIEKQLIFGELTTQNKHSVSFAHSFYAGANANLKLNAEAGLQYLNNEVEMVDKNTIEALNDFLHQTSYEKLPDFIFVHLIGYDSLAHENGYKSKDVKKYISILDQRLRPIFEKLNNYERNNKKIITIMTADHGFVDPKYHIDLEEKVQKKHDDLVVLNEGRLLSVYFRKGIAKPKLDAFAKDIANEKGVGFVSYRQFDKLSLFSKKQEINIFYRSHDCGDASFQISIQNGKGVVGEWYCPQDVDHYFKYKNYPQFFNLVSHYYQSIGHSDLLVVAEDNVSFDLKEKGVHGGFTPDEIYVPILMKNAVAVSAPVNSSIIPAAITSQQAESVIFNYQLLKFLNLKATYSK